MNLGTIFCPYMSFVPCELRTQSIHLQEHYLCCHDAVSNTVLCTTPCCEQHHAVEQKPIVARHGLDMYTKQALLLYAIMCSDKGDAAGLNCLGGHVQRLLWMMPDPRSETAIQELTHPLSAAS